MDSPFLSQGPMYSMLHMSQLVQNNSTLQERCRDLQRRCDRKHMQEDETKRLSSTSSCSDLVAEVREKEQKESTQEETHRSEKKQFS